MNRFVAILILLAALAGRAWAADASAAFDAANRLFTQGKFAAAADSYEKIIQSGAASAAVYFNLGNAHFKAGQFGRAIAAYRQAEQISPRDPDVLANLQFARNQINNAASVKPGMAQRALGWLTFNEWASLAGAAVAVWFILLALGQWRAAWRGALKNFVLLAGLAVLLFGAGAIADWAANASVKSAVVVTAETAVHTGPLDDAQTSFTAKDGAELTVLGEREDWLQVQNGHRQTGWVKRATVRVL